MFFVVVFYNSSISPKCSFHFDKTISPLPFLAPLIAPATLALNTQVMAWTTGPLHRPLLHAHSFPTHTHMGRPLTSFTFGPMCHSICEALPLCLRNCKSPLTLAQHFTRLDHQGTQPRLIGSVDSHWSAPVGRMFAHVPTYPELQLPVTRPRPHEVLSIYLWLSVDASRGSNRAVSHWSPFLRPVRKHHRRPFHFILTRSP